MSYRNRVWVDHAALRHNVARVRQLLDERELIAVVKADAYGLGLERCAGIYAAAGVRTMAVASLGEARRLRSAAPAVRIVVLGQPLPEERAAMVAEGYELCCSDAGELAASAALAGDAPVPVHIFVDTGMGRSGCDPARAPQLAAEIDRSPRLRLAGLATHYPDATQAGPSQAQEDRFAALVAACGPLPADCLVHVANSEGVLMRPAIGNAARVGLLLTGCEPIGCPPAGLRQALRWESALTLIKNLPAGHGVSYGSTVHLERDSRVGLVPVGYADGYPFAASGRSQVVVAGQRCPLLGRVTMDYLVIDLTDCPAAAVGSPVELCGPTMPVAELAAAARTIPYDILCGLRGRCEVVGCEGRGAGECTAKSTRGVVSGS